MKKKYSTLLNFAICVALALSIASCEGGCEKKRPLNPTERAWIEKHPDGTKRSKPEDFEEFKIKDRCDPSLEGGWQWKRQVAAEEPTYENGQKPDNIPPTAVMSIELLTGTRFKFSGVRSKDPDSATLNFEWSLNWVTISREPEFEVDLKKGEIYHVVLNVWNMNEGDRGGNSYKMGSSIDFDLVVDNVTCPEE